VGVNGGNQAGKVGMAVEAFAAFVGAGVATFSDTLPVDPNSLRDMNTKSMTVYNYPSQSMRSTYQATLNPVARQPDDGLQLFQVRTMMVGRGRIDRRDQLAWTYTLDGHDYYVLRLGDDQTIVYDLSTGQWVDWGETDVGLDGQPNVNSRWRLATGMNWRGLSGLADEKGSDVVVGDDTYGMLHVLDPLYEVDYHAEIDDTRPFERRAQGMITMSGRDSVPVFGVQLTGSAGEQYDDTLVNVELKSSDDWGHTYFSHGVLQADKSDYNIRTDWNGLGSITSPGRLFLIVDDGALARIDSLDTYDAKS
jgi:hypothetical protein